MASVVGSRKKGVARRITDLLTCRQILNLMVILGFMFNYMLRVNLTLAIVEMVFDIDEDVTAKNNTLLPDKNLSVATLQSASLVVNFSDSATSTAASVISTTSSPNVSNHPHHVTKQSLNHKFHWDKYLQNYVLGSFFFGYILTELPGGRLAEVIGARKVFGGGMLLASLLTLLTPVACYVNVLAVIALRALVGFCLGATFPATPPMAAKWIPPLERSGFIANMMAASLGAAMTMPVAGLIVSSWGWESVFYVTGCLGVLWSVAWFYFVYDSPAQHPRISAEERYEIESKIAEETAGRVKPDKVPWRQMLTSAPVWAIVITHGASVFAYFTVVNQLPTFFKEVLHVEIKKNGLLSSLPYLGKYIMAVLASSYADRLRKARRFSTTAIRKGFTLVAVLTPGIFMVIQALFGDQMSLSVTIFTCSLFFNGAVTGGYLTNGLDIAPNFSGTIMGMANTLSSIGGWLSSVMVASLTNKSHTFDQWKYVFWILAVVYVIGAVTFTIFGSAELQSWNSTENAVIMKELQPLADNHETERNKDVPEKV